MANYIFGNPEPVHFPEERSTSYDLQGYGDCNRDVESATPAELRNRSYNECNRKALDISRTLNTMDVSTGTVRDRHGRRVQTSTSPAAQVMNRRRAAGLQGVANDIAKFVGRTKGGRKSRKLRRKTRRKYKSKTRRKTRRKTLRKKRKYKKNKKYK
jgi:hypothetical protein